MSLRLLSKTWLRLLETLRLLSKALLLETRLLSKTLLWLLEALLWSWEAWLLALSWLRLIWLLGFEGILLSKQRLDNAWAIWVRTKAVRANVALD